jgi:hypothetical protein
MLSIKDDLIALRIEDWREFFKVSIRKKDSFTLISQRQDVQFGKPISGSIMDIT